MKTTIRKAKLSDLSWVNSCYDSVNFIHSNFDSEIIAIAKADNENTGVGRLIFIDEQTYELGGIYVNEKFRGKGVARKLIDFLLHSVHNKTIYCIPFKELEKFYKSFGFEECPLTNNVPQKIYEKVEFCKRAYAKPTVLLIRTTP